MYFPYAWCSKIRVCFPSRHAHPTLTPRSHHGHHMVTPRSSHGHHTITPRSPHVHPTFTPWSSHCHPTVTPQSPHVHPTVIPRSPHNHMHGVVLWGWCIRIILMKLCKWTTPVLNLRFRGFVWGWCIRIILVKLCNSHPTFTPQSSHGHPTITCMELYGGGALG